jgi:hypothetical protein
MGRLIRVLIVAVGAIALFATLAVPARADEGGNLTDFSTMSPVTGSAVGAVNDRGIKGGGVPWVISAGSGTVSHQGMVDVTVTGLVIPSVGNKNPVASFKATVSCLGPSGVTNVSTGNFPASAAGDSHIQALIDLPHPCKQPIIFVAAPTGQWFAESDPDMQP